MRRCRALLRASVNRHMSHSLPPSPPPPGPPLSPEARLADLERSLAALAADVAELRAELSQPVGPRLVGDPPRAGSRGVIPLRPGAARPAGQPPERDMRRGERRKAAAVNHDLERLLGRYGMLIIAGLAAAGAVGTFLSWAIGHGYIEFGPATRVLVGVAVAIGLGVWGLRLRRTERSFGSSIVGLALAIALVCAYGAGPGFHLVPTLVAFAGAAVISWALALFALSQEDEPLWCIGVSGAALTPFVASNGQGNVFALLVYGLVVTLPAALAVGQRSWPVAWRVFYAATALYAITGAALGADRGTAGVLAAMGFPFVLAVGAVIPFVPIERKRGALRWMVALAVVAAVIDRLAVRDTAIAIAISSLWAATASLLLVDAIADIPQSSIVASLRSEAAPLDWIDAAAIPSALLYLYAGLALTTRQHIAFYAVGVVAFSVFSFRRAVGALRDASAVGAVAAAFVLITALTFQPVPNVGALLVAGLAALGAHVWRPSRGWMFGAGALIAVAAVESADQMCLRGAYHYTPFATEASIAAAAVTVALLLIARFRASLVEATRHSIPVESTTATTSPAPPSTPERAMASSVWVWAFVWGLIELARAYSPSTSTLLLVTYFAATGVACVAAGRARDFALLRQIGLGLALIAAGTAIYGASTFFDFGARILAYLVTSVFLLGIAYWYRRPGAATVAEA